MKSDTVVQHHDSRCTFGEVVRFGIGLSRIRVKSPSGAEIDTRIIPAPDGTLPLQIDCSLSFAQHLSILKTAIQAAARPRKGIIPPELLGSTEHQLHFSLS
jgi:hypothetical protein